MEFRKEQELNRRQPDDWGLATKQYSKKAGTLAERTILGVGAYRVVLELCQEHVLKVEPGGSYSTRWETKIWNSASEETRQKLCPIIDFEIRKNGSWVLMPKCKNIAQMTQAVLDKFEDMFSWFTDIHGDNIGKLDKRWVAIDYGYTDNPKKTNRELTMGLV